MTIIDELRATLKAERRLAESGIKLLSSSEVAEKLSISRKYFETKIMHKQAFPRPVQLTENGRLKWYAHEVDEFILKLGRR